ncbi:MAG TPA: CPBP family intramembrane glutamic endopeptidase [Rubrobacteraceae bacterium]|nr:CPBP family intramembrane glutamic endopeptidase [Rubrobacteraceae bacterium]
MVVLNAVLAGLTVGLFWGGVLVARAFGVKAVYSLAPLGFSRPRGGVFAAIGIGVSVGVGALIASLPINAASTFVLDYFGYPTESMVQGPFMRGLTRWVEESPGLAIPAIILVVVFLGPAVEELVFRGAVFNGLYRLGGYLSKGLGGPEASPRAARWLSFALAALASSALFSLLHLEPVLLPALLILAVGLCALFARTGSLLPSFVAHATFNSFATSLIILSGLGVVEIPL